MASTKMSNEPVEMDESIVRPNKDQTSNNNAIAI